MLLHAAFFMPILFNLTVRFVSEILFFYTIQTKSIGELAGH